MTQVSKEKAAKIWEEIFSLQAELNTFVAKKKNLPTEFSDLWDLEKQRTSSTLSKTQEDWLLQYSRATWHEVEELYTCREKVGDVDTVVEEAVDVLHFLVSMGIIVGLQPAEIDSTVVSTNPYLRIDTFCDVLRNQLIQLERRTNWKWWSKKKVLFTAVLKTDVANMLSHLVQIFYRFDLDLYSILDEYKLKHAENVKRQEDGYKARD